VGEVQQKDVKRAAVMREKREPEYAVILAFDAQTPSSAQDLAKREKVRIVFSKSIYELETALDALAGTCKQTAQQEAAKDVVFPVVMKTLCSLRKSPMVLGCLVQAGQLRVGTPLCVQAEGRQLVVGRVANIQMDGSPVEVARRGDQVGVELEQVGKEEQLTYGKGQPIFSGEQIYSQITRRSADALKRHFSGKMLAEDWRVLEALRRL